jgi:predicted nuclease of predicted toxin-antitoxin system
MCIASLGTAGAAIWEHARNNGFAIVSKDGDFHHLSMLRGAPPRVIWLRVGNASTADILRLLLAQEDAIKRFEKNDASTFLVLDSGARRR